MGLNIAITSKYNPFTYEDYIKPLEGYWEDYDKAEQDIASAKSDLAKIDAYMNEVEATDKALYDQYKSYRTQLNNISTSLNSSGLTKDIRNQLRDLPTTYNSTILPIIEGLGKMNEYKKGVSALRNKGVIVEENPENKKLSTHMGLKVPYENKMITKDAVAKLAEEMTKNITANMDPSFTSYLSGLVLTSEGIKPGDILNNTLNSEQQRTVDTIRNRIKASIASQLGADSFNSLDRNVQMALSTEIDNGMITGATYATSVTKAGKGGGNSSDSSGDNSKNTYTLIGIMPVGVPADLTLTPDPNNPQSGKSSTEIENAKAEFNKTVRDAIERHLPKDMNSTTKQQKIDYFLNQYGSGTRQYVYCTTKGTYHYYIQIPKYKKVKDTYIEDTDQNGNTKYTQIPIVTYSYQNQFKDSSKVKKDPLSFLEEFKGSDATQN